MSYAEKVLREEADWQRIHGTAEKAEDCIAHADLIEQSAARDAEFAKLKAHAEELAKVEAALAESERKCERVKHHAEAMANDLDVMGINAEPFPSLRAYRRDYPKEGA